MGSCRIEFSCCGDLCHFQVYGDFERTKIQLIIHYSFTYMCTVPYDVHIHTYIHICSLYMYIYFYSCMCMYVLHRNGVNTVKFATELALIFKSVIKSVWWNNTRLGYGYGLLIKEIRIILQLHYLRLGCATSAGPPPYSVQIQMHVCRHLLRVIDQLTFPQLLTVEYCSITKEIYLISTYKQSWTLVNYYKHVRELLLKDTYLFYIFSVFITRIFMYDLPLTL